VGGKKTGRVWKEGREGWEEKKRNDAEERGKGMGWEATIGAQ
jgi:hypothetical protein